MGAEEAAGTADKNAAVAAETDRVTRRHRDGGGPRGRSDRRPLVVDLDTGVMQAGAVQRRLEPGAKSPEVLSGYLAMVRDARSVPQGGPVALRVGDIEVLSGALHMDPGEVTISLKELMAGAPAVKPVVRERSASAGRTAASHRSRRGLVVGLVLAAVVVVALAALVPLSRWWSSGDGPATTTTIVPESTSVPGSTAIPTTVPAATVSVPATGLPPNPTVSIGEPAVQERNP